MSYRGSTPFAALLPDVENSAIPPKATARMAPPDIKSDNPLSQKEVLFPLVAKLVDQYLNSPAWTKPQILLEGAITNADVVSMNHGMSISPLASTSHLNSTILGKDQDDQMDIDQVARVMDGVSAPRSKNGGQSEGPITLPIPASSGPLILLGTFMGKSAMSTLLLLNHKGDGLEEVKCREGSEGKSTMASELPSLPEADGTYQMDCTKVQLNVGPSLGINPESVNVDQPLRDLRAGQATVTPFEAGTAMATAGEDCCIPQINSIEDEENNVK